MEGTLTAGAITKIKNEEVKSQADMIPILQVTRLKQVDSHQDTEIQRFMMALSDGTQHLQGVLNTSLNSLIDDEILKTGSIVRLTQFTSSETLTIRFLVVMELEVITSNADVIGLAIRAEDIDDQPGSE